MEVAVDIVGKETEAIVEVGCPGEGSTDVHPDEEGETRLLVFGGGAASCQEQRGEEQDLNPMCHGFLLVLY